MNYILMNTEMTRAILDGRKVQTRRLLKVRTDIDSKAWLDSLVAEYAKYKVGDVIWVREPAKVISFRDDGNYGGSWVEARATVQYLADECEISWDEFPEEPKSWLWECKGIPNGCSKSLARIFLKITNVRVEKLQDIGSGNLYDYEKEGIVIRGLNRTSRMIKEEYINIWNKTAPKGYKWEDNPYALVYDFEVISKENAQMTIKELR